MVDGTPEMKQTTGGARSTSTAQVASSAITLGEAWDQDRNTEIAREGTEKTVITKKKVHDKASKTIWTQSIIMELELAGAGFIETCVHSSLDMTSMITA